ncbi:MAG: hypothetical protein BWY76_00523 [bacterium ADurb.Bin429]|nr:MAG: hypothetical protein BWY76_00523 [bacterium ADurb.Bin429]
MPEPPQREHANRLQSPAIRGEPGGIGIAPSADDQVATALKIFQIETGQAGEGVVGVRVAIAEELVPLHLGDVGQRLGEADGGIARRLRRRAVFGHRAASTAVGGAGADERLVVLHRAGYRWIGQFVVIRGIAAPDALHPMRPGGRRGCGSPVDDRIVGRALGLRGQRHPTLTQAVFRAYRGECAIGTIEQYAELTRSARRFAVQHDAVNHTGIILAEVRLFRERVGEGVVAVDGAHRQPAFAGLPHGV